MRYNKSPRSDREARRVPRELREFVDAELREGEKIAWMGCPNARPFPLPTLPLVLFAIPWTAFAVFWIVSAASMGDSGPGSEGVFRFFPLFGVPFVLVGIGMLSSPLWALRRASKFVYVVTDRRAIIVGGLFSRTVTSYGPERITHLSRKEKKDGSGDLFFQSEVAKQANLASLQPQRSFLGIPDVKAVEDMVREMVAAHK